MDPAMIELVKTIGTQGPLVALILYLLIGCDKERQADKNRYWTREDTIQKEHREEIEVMLRERRAEHEEIRKEIYNLRELILRGGGGDSHQRSG